MYIHVSHTIYIYIYMYICICTHTDIYKCIYVHLYSVYMEDPIMIALFASFGRPGGEDVEPGKVMGGLDCKQILKHWNASDCFFYLKSHASTASQTWHQIWPA